MENIRTENTQHAPMTLREASVELLELARALEQSRPTDAAYMAGYIARFVETAPQHSA